MKKISVVIPMYYEEEVAKECYNRLKGIVEKIDNYEYEIIFINDGSKDKTLPILMEIAEKERVSVEDAAALLGCNPQSVREHMKRGLWDIGSVIPPIPPAKKFSYHIYRHKLYKHLGKE